MRILTVTLLILAVYTPAIVLAQAIPPALTAADYRACLAGCPAANGTSVCEVLCRCTADEIATTFELPDYLDFRKGLSTGDFTPETKAKLDEIGETCARLIPETD